MKNYKKRRNNAPLRFVFTRLNRRPLHRGYTLPMLLLAASLLGGCKAKPEATAAAPEQADIKNAVEAPGGSVIRVELDRIKLDGEVVQVMGHLKDSRTPKSERPDRRSTLNLEIPNLAEALEGAAGEESAPLSIHAHPFTSYEWLAATLYTVNQPRVKPMRLGLFNPDDPEASVRELWLRGRPDGSRPAADRRELDLVVSIGFKGYNLALKGGQTGEQSLANLPAIKGCPEEGPTICLDDPSFDVMGKLQQAIEAYDVGDTDRGDASLAEIQRAYPIDRLYSILVKTKKQFPSETLINITASSELPVVLVMDVLDFSGYRLSKDAYPGAKELRDAYESAYPKRGERLFPHASLIVVQ